MMRVAVVGAGINGVMSAWALARRGHEVALFERGEPMAGTSSASTRLLHGGLRYLETGDLALVRKGLRERAWWLTQAPRLAHPLEILLPVVRGRGRPRWMLKAGLALYDRLGDAGSLPRHRWLARDEVRARLPDLRAEGLEGAYAYWDGQMDDRALGLWALAQARAAGVRLHGHCEVVRVGEDGTLMATRAPDAGLTRLRFDAVCNLAGPAAARLLERSGLRARHRLRLVRGSHLFVDAALPCGLLVQAPSDGRVCFVLPWGGRAMVGTTEVEQGLDDPVVPSDAERDYLLGVWNATFERALTAADIRGDFAGVRPLVAEAGALSANTREHVIERHGCVLTAFGGKWTTSRSLGEQVADAVERGR